MMAADNKPQTATEVLIEGRYYDITTLKHPGGSIVKFLTGNGDATEAFREFHYRSPKARKVLASLTNRPAPAPAKGQERQTKMSQDFVKLRRELEAEGWFKPSYAHLLYRISELVVLHAIGICMLLYTGFWLPALAILGIGEGRCGWLMHEGGHYSLTGYMPFDVKLQEFFYAMGCGMSGAWWRNQHNRHHATPQKLKHDVDLDTLPLVAFNSVIAAKAKNSPVLRSWLYIQSYMFPLITCSLVAAFWQLFLHPRHMIRTHRYFEMLCCAVRYSACVLLAHVAGVSFWQAVGAYYVYQFFGAGYIFCNFALSHTHLDVTKADEHVHWLEYGSKYTIDITPHWFTNWWMGYLNYQIEHHLFPTMPQYRFVRLHPRIRKLFRENGLTYDCRDYFAAVRDTFGNLSNVGASIK
jgi:fatty acid desaturase